MKIAINRTVIGKPSSDKEIKKMTFTYENSDLNQEELAHHINLGYAFCAQHKNKRRKSANFISAGFLAVDIDAGMTIHEALDNDFMKNHGAILYTTPSHTDDFPRFRIVFELEREITESEDMKNAYRGIIKIFGGDPSCKDACRQFFGSKDSDPLIFNKIMTASVIDEVILLGSESKGQTDTKVGTSSGERHSIVSRRVLDPDTQIMDSDGIAHRLQDLSELTAVHCPVHADNKPSAFIVKSKKGVAGVHCSTCGTTYFSSSDMPLYDFNYGLTNLTELSLEEYEAIEENEFFTLSTTHKNIIKMNEPYLSEVDTVAPITLAKSPKGTGKTQWLERIVEECKKNHLSVLLIGHRQSLIQSVAQRLDLKPYLYEYAPSADDHQSDRLKTNKPTKHYAICADSLTTLLNTKENKYDVILIDEVEQVFSHLTSSTLKDRRIETFLYFKHYVNAAKQIYVMDADLNELTVNTLWDFIDDKEKTVQFIINEYSQQGRDLNLYESKSHLHQDLVSSIDSNLRCFVCSNSKKQVSKLKQYIEERFSKKKVMAITSDNSQEFAIQEFIRNIKTAVLDYDVVIVSPSVGTGVDITFPNKEQEIDVVYGFFEARVNTHFDIDQQISRVRHPKSIKVWISPETFRFDTNQEVIKREVEQSDRSSRQLIGIEPDGALIYNTNDEYLNLYSNVKLMQRGSKNNLRYHFKKLKEHEGWTINEVDRDKDSAIAGLEVDRRGKELYEFERRQKILNAKLITKNEYINLRGNSQQRKKLTAEEENAMRRYEIESFYYQDVTNDLVTADKDGKHRQQIRQYEYYTKPDSDLLEQDLMEDKKSLHKTDKKTLLARKEFLHQLFVSAGLADQDKDFITNKTIEGDSLSDFADFCVKHKETIARWFEIDIRNDIHKKPAQQLGRFLKLHGISWTKLNPIKRNGIKVYRYEIAQSTIDEMDAIVDLRLDTSITQKWHDERKDTTENRLFEQEEEEEDLDLDGISSLINL